MLYHNMVLQLQALPESPISEIQALPIRHPATLDGLYADMKKISEAMHHYAELLQEESTANSPGGSLQRAFHFDT